MGFVLWLAAVLAGGAVAAAHADALGQHFETRAFDPRNVALMWAIYPLVKLAHELAHGLAVKRWGGAVHEAGVMLLVFTPVPYVNASASTAFPDRRHRMLVAAAGIMAELLLGTLALLAWLELPPGLARDAAFDVMLVGVGSTLLFNGNPLLRFDGYHVLADALEIPNLGPRSSRYLAYLGERHLLGIPGAVSPVTAPGEPGWLLAYGVASVIYRVAVLLTIAIYVAGKLFFIGVILAIWVLSAQLVLPLVRFGSFLARSPHTRGCRVRAGAVAAGLAALTGGALLLVPVAAATRAEGLVQPPAGAEVRAGTDGLVAEVRVRDGQSVNAGDVLLVLEDPALPAEVRRARWRLRELERLHARASLRERVRGQILALEREQARAELDDARERLARLAVRSPARGTVRIESPADLPGRFVTRGERLALVLGAGAARARVVVPQEAAARVRGETRAVAVRIETRPGATLAARVAREIPAATERLPSRSLGSQGGGRIAVDARDETGRRALGRVFEFELALPGSALAYRPGARVHVRFEHPAEPLAVQWYRGLRRLLLARFQV